jgi:hypothetical protein
MNRIHSANAAMYDTVKSIQISVNKKGKSAMPAGGNGKGAIPPVSANGNSGAHKMIKAAILLRPSPPLSHPSDHLRRQAAHWGPLQPRNGHLSKWTILRRMSCQLCAIAGVNNRNATVAIAARDWAVSCCRADVFWSTEDPPQPLCAQRDTQRRQVR